MKQQLVPFDFEGSQVRVVTDAQGEPWFVAADVLLTISVESQPKLSQFPRFTR